MNQRQQLEQKLIEKALKDESFRQKLLSNPKEVIEAEFGRKIPESIQINVLEEDANTVYLILPQVAQNPEMELTETELNAVAGGDEPWSVFECKSLEGPCYK